MNENLELKKNVHVDFIAMHFQKAANLMIAKSNYKKDSQWWKRNNSLFFINVESNRIPDIMIIY